MMVYLRDFFSILNVRKILRYTSVLHSLLVGVGREERIEPYAPPVDVRAAECVDRKTLGLALAPSSTRPNYTLYGFPLPTKQFMKLKE